MKVFKKVFKNKLFYLVLLLGVFLTPIFKFTLQAQEEDYVEVDSILEFNVIDFTNNELDVDPATVYNFFRNGFSFNNDVTFLLNDVEYNVTSYTINHLKEYTMEVDVDGETYKITTTPTKLDIYSYIEVHHDDVVNLENMRFVWTSYSLPNLTSVGADYRFDDIVFLSNDNSTIYNGFSYLTHTISSTRRYDIRYYRDDVSSNGVKINDDSRYIASKYRNIDFISGNLDNMELINIFKGLKSPGLMGKFYDKSKGFNNGDNVKITLHNLIPESYLGFIAQQIYDDGYQNGVNDTHDYYNDNGLFIPRSTPKAHIVVDYDLRYGEPYFYLQDFAGVYDGVYFGFEHNRWLEKAFDWAYSVESDFLAINDLYTIEYKSDEVIYKYFFYKYDTDSIYFYNDNGTLLKIVERVVFDYYVYEVPELSQEEQTRIDNAYNRGMSDYGYYDSVSEKYLTATEYGEIRYNQGVISTRDKAYLDGFIVAMWHSHNNGYDWLRATYSDLIAESSITYRVSDITSFTYQAGYDEGFDDGEVVGYDKGYDDGLDDGFDDGFGVGYDEGFDDGEIVGYNEAVTNTPEVIYDKIYNKGFSDGQKTGMNNKFYTGLEKWIVPAIIVVLFFGLLMLFPRNKED